MRRVVGITVQKQRIQLPAGTVIGDKVCVVNPFDCCVPDFSTVPFRAGWIQTFQGISITRFSAPTSDFLSPSCLLAFTGSHAEEFVPYQPDGCTLLARGVIPGTTTWYLCFWMPLAAYPPTLIAPHHPSAIITGLGEQWTCTYGPYDPIVTEGEGVSSIAVAGHHPAGNGHVICSILMSDTGLDPTLHPSGLDDITVDPGWSFFTYNLRIVCKTAQPSTPIGPWTWPLGTSHNAVTLSVMIA